MGRNLGPWRAGSYALATIHRAENTNDDARLLGIMKCLDWIANTRCPVVWPVHPRTAKRLAHLGIVHSATTRICPVTYLEMLLLESRARFIVTDSGGVQKEAYFLRIPCITLRDETEWEETLINGCNVLSECSPDKIVNAVDRTAEAGPWTCVYGDGKSGSAMLNYLSGIR